MLNKSSSAPVKSSVLDDARPRRCDAEFPYEDISSEKFSPEPHLQVIYRNGDAVDVAVREVLGSGALLVHERPTVLSLNDVTTVKALNREGAQILEEIAEKLEKVFEVNFERKDFVAGDLEKMNSCLTGLEWRERVVHEIRMEAVLVLGKKLAEQMNDNVSQGEVKKPEEVPLKQDVVAA